MNVLERYPKARCHLEDGSIKITGVPGEEEDQLLAAAIRNVDPDAVRRNRGWILSPESASCLGGLGLHVDQECLDFTSELERARAQRERANRWVSQLSMAQKRDWLASRSVRMRREPFDHQVNAIGWSLINPFSALFLDTGLGKTFIISTVMQAIKDKGVARPFLVVAPKTLLHGSWDEEVAQSTWLRSYNMCEPPEPPPVFMCPICGNSVNRRSTKKHMLGHMPASSIDSFYEANIHTAPMALISRDKLAMAALNGNEADVYLINPDMLRSIGEKLVGRFHMIVVDESSMMRSHESKTTNAILQIGRSCTRRIIASGTPRPNTDLELWAQFAMLDGGLGQSFYYFRNKYFSKSADGYSYYMRPGVGDSFRSTVNERCLSYKLDDCVDLPGETTEKRIVDLHEDTLKYYNEMKKYDGDKVAHYLGEKNAKLEETVRTARSLVEDQDRQVVIWIRYSRFEAEAIKNHLSDLGVSIVVGGQDSNLTFNEITKFKSGKNKIMVAHPLSAKFGHTWVSANVAIFHSYDFSWENYYQAKRRIYRIGQKNPVTYINMIARKTIDEGIMRAIAKKEKNSEMAFDKKLMSSIMKETSSE